MAENVLHNIQNIELGAYVLDDTKKASNCIIFHTMRRNYCFRLAESIPLEAQVGIFNQMAEDLSTPLEQKGNEPELPLEPAANEPVTESKGE